MSEPEMGATAKDRITDFVGKVTGRSEYINGCVHLMLEAKAKPGMKPVHAWFDADRCIPKISIPRKKPIRKSTVTSFKRPGGPMSHSND